MGLSVVFDSLPLADWFEMRKILIEVWSNIAA